MNNIIEGKRFGNCTNFPKIFNGTYWSKFIYGDSGINTNFEEMKMITDNRNKFVIDFQIKKLASIPSSLRFFVYDCYLLDHLEIYKNKQGDYILICSPYNKQDGLLNIGFKEYNKLYCGHAYTYILVIHNLKDFVKNNKEILKKK